MSCENGIRWTARLPNGRIRPEIYLADRAIFGYSPAAILLPDWRDSRYCTEAAGRKSVVGAWHAEVGAKEGEGRKTDGLPA